MLELTTVVDIIIIIIIIGQARAAARRLCWGGEGGGCIPPGCGQSSGSLHPVGTAVTYGAQVWAVNKDVVQSGPISPIGGPHVAVCASLCLKKVLHTAMT